MGEELVASVLNDWRSANLKPELGAALEFLEVYANSNRTIESEQVDKLLDTGMSKDQIVEVINVAWCFTILSKWADSLDFPVTPNDVFKPIGKMMYRFGYKSVCV
ncbi:MAG: hypothetical protein AAGA30_08965 [Planctomycetota bacterium]